MNLLNRVSKTENSSRFAASAVLALFVEANLFTNQPLHAQVIAEPAVSKQVEHPNNTPVAELFSGSYADSTDDPTTGLSQHNPNQIDMAIGEEFNYIVTISYPEGTTADTFLIDQASPTTQIGAFDDTVIEIISAEVIHVGTNLSGGLPALGFQTIRDLNPIDGDGSQFQYGSATSDVTVVADGVTDDKDRVVIRILARLDDEDDSGGLTDALDANNIDGRDATNRVQIAWNFGANTQQRNSFGTVDIVESDLSISLSVVDDSSVAIGDTVSFELTVSNVGTATAYNVEITDTLPNDGVDDFLLFDAIDAANSTCDEIAGFAVIGAAPPDVDFSFDQLAAGTSCVIQFDATVDTSITPGDVYTNGVEITSYDSRDNNTDDDNRNYSGPTATATVTAATVDLELTKSDGDFSANPGDTIVYSLVHANTGGLAATGVVLTETVPANTRFNPSESSVGWNCLPNNNAGSTCTLDLGTLSPGACSTSTLFAVDVDLPVLAGVDAIANTASIADDGTNGIDANLLNNTAQDTTPVTAGVDMRIDKDDRDRTAKPGETIPYALSIDNIGDQNATGVIMTETVPQHTTFNAGASSAGWTCADGAPAGTNCEFDLSAIIGGQFDGNEDLVVLVTFAVDVDATIPSGVYEISNTISVTDDGNNGVDSDLQNNESSAVTPLEATRLLITKTALPPDDTEFDFALDFGTNATVDFTLSDPTDDEIIFNNALAGQYTITEFAVDGWLLESVFCNSPDFTWAGNVTTVGLDADADVVCTFSNVRDCNSNGVNDATDITTTFSDDCQPNGIPDECEIAAGSSLDGDLDGVPNECDNCPTLANANQADSDNDGTGDVCESSSSGGGGVLIFDADGDGVTDGNDLCFNTPTGSVVNQDGCSDEQLDDDNDGVSNDVDQCEETPAGEPVDDDGCSQSQIVVEPEPTPSPSPSPQPSPEPSPSPSPTPAPDDQPLPDDSDDDGVSDDEDDCPNPAGTGPNGCPVENDGNDTGGEEESMCGAGAGPCGPIGAVSLWFTFAVLTRMRYRRRIERCHVALHHEKH